MRVLLVASRPLDQARRGDQLRAREIRGALAGHQLTVLAPGDGWRPPSLGEQGLALARSLISARPLQPALVASRDLIDQVTLRAPDHDLVVVMLARLAPAVMAAAGTPVLVDLVDALSLNAASRALVESPLARMLFRREARELARLEAEVVAASRTAVAVNERDRQVLAKNMGPTLAPKLGVIPLAMAPRLRSLDDVATPVPRRIVLSGNLGYFVNRDAVLTFLDGPWPALSRAGCELVVVGDRPGRSLARRIRAAGAQLVAAPADLTRWLATGAVAVAPTRCGSGVPVKVLEAWSLGVPVVASPFAAAGAGLIDGESGLVAAEPLQWVESITRLMADPALGQRLAAGGYQRLEHEHNPGRVDHLWRERAELAITI